MNHLQRVHISQAESHIKIAESEHCDDNDNYQTSLLFATIHALLSKCDDASEHYGDSAHYLALAEDLRNDGREFEPSLMFAHVHALLAR